MEMTFNKSMIIKNINLLVRLNKSLSARTRRKLLIDSQNELNDQKIGCENCEGFCCTYTSNSMRITPLEALDIIELLIKEDRLNSELIHDLKINVEKYRLNREVTDGRGRFIRRYYTCPFFRNHSLGCSIGLNHKPYACISFNPKEANISKEDQCSQNKVLLSLRDEGFIEDEELINQKIKDCLKLYWNNLPIPSALLDIIPKLETYKVVDANALD